MQLPDDYSFLVDLQYEKDFKMNKRLLIALMVLLAACGGTAATTTTGATATEATTNDTVDLAEMPQECIDAFVGFLRAIEPVVADFDFESASLNEIDAMGTELEAVGEAQTAEMETSNCPDVAAWDEATFAAMIDVAEREAPATIPYVRWIEGLSESLGGEGGTVSSGDCETDIEALEGLMAEKETIGDMTMSEAAEIAALMTAIGTACSEDRRNEFLAQPEVAAFLDSQG